MKKTNSVNSRMSKTVQKTLKGVVIQSLYAIVA